MDCRRGGALKALGERGPRRRVVAPAKGSALATVALASVTLAAIAGMARLFRGASFAGPLVATAITAHLTCWGGRRLRAPAWVASALALLLAALVGVWTTIPSATLWGLPTPGTAHRIVSELSRSRTDFALLRAPVPATVGFELTGVAATGVVATVADWAAFRHGLGVEAVLPSFTLVVFTDALGTAAGRVVATAIYALSAAVFALAQEARWRSLTTRWVGAGAEAGKAGLAGRGLLLGTTAVVIGAVLGPALPGAGASPLVHLNHQLSQGAGQRTTISPLVDVRSTEVSEAGTELFTVKAASPAYWRLTALDHFDGSVWSADQRYRPARAVTRPLVRGARLDQRVTISQLSEPWLPAAYLPSTVELAGSAIDPASGSLVAGSDTSPGMTYEVSSVLPDPTATDLEQVGWPDLRQGLAGDYNRMVQLPADLPGPILQQAKNVVAGQETPYVRALALQDFLRDNFHYSLTTVPAGHDDDALANFLFVTHTGFCEQFSAAYAVMARAVGLPARVAVGFTPGVRRGGTFHVYGVHAHAWPEVYLGPRFGWVAFEPTPGRGEPGATGWTDVTPQQAARVPAPSAATIPGPAPARAAPAGSSLASGLRGLLATGGGSSLPQAPGGPNALVIAAAVTAGTFLVGLSCAPLLRRLHTRRRRRRARDPSERVLLAWREAGEELEAVGLARAGGETPSEYARRAGENRLGPEGAKSMVALAELTAAAAYSRGVVSGETAATAVAAASRVSTDLGARLPAWRRLLLALDPRRLVPKGTPALRDETWGGADQ